jgi:hypothetical protein
MHLTLYNLDRIEPGDVVVQAGIAWPYNALTFVARKGRFVLIHVKGYSAWTTRMNWKPTYSPAHFCIVELERKLPGVEVRNGDVIEEQDVGRRPSVSKAAMLKRLDELAGAA